MSETKSLRRDHGTLRSLSARAIAVAVVAGLMVVAGGCADSKAADPEVRSGDTVVQNTADLLGPSNPAAGEPVLIGMITDGSTAAYDNTDELRAGKAVAAFANEHQGGIGGRPIELVTCETGGTPEGGIDCANQMVQKNTVAVAVSQSVATETISQALHQSAIPFWTPQAFSDEMATDPQSTFLVFNSRAAFFGLPVAVAKAADAKKLAFVVIDIPQATEILEGQGAQLLHDAGFEFDVVRVPVGTADMTSQMQQVVSSGAGVVQVIGNDSFCIAAFQGLAAVGYDGPITAVNQCITDATREALPDGLEGINILSTVALNANDDPTWQLYQAVIAEYGKDVEDVNNFIPVGGYAAMASLVAALHDITGDINPQSVATAIRAMPESIYPAGGGITYRCDGTAVSSSPAICTNQWLRTQLDATGNATTYTVEDSSDLFDQAN